jgi:hypothetical protein
MVFWEGKEVWRRLGGFQPTVWYGEPEMIFLGGEQWNTIRTIQD